MLRGIHRYDHPDFLLIIAAGNSGRDRTSKSIASPGLNKNGITVGASQNSSPHINSGMLGPDYLAEFSSRGPAGDGRRKPDVIAPGMFIESARAHPDSQGECDDNGGLSLKLGTSMSTPMCAGAAALVRQYFEEGWHVSGNANPDNGFSPRASLVKAVILNGAVDLQIGRLPNATFRLLDLKCQTLATMRCAIGTTVKPPRESNCRLSVALDSPFLSPRFAK